MHAPANQSNVTLAKAGERGVTLPATYNDAKGPEEAAQQGAKHPVSPHNFVLQVSRHDRWKKTKQNTNSLPASARGPEQLAEASSPPLLYLSIVSLDPDLILLHLHNFADALKTHSSAG